MKVLEFQYRKTKKKFFQKNFKNFLVIFQNFFQFSLLFKFKFEHSVSLLVEFFGDEWDDGRIVTSFRF